MFKTNGKETVNQMSEKLLWQRQAKVLNRRTSMLKRAANEIGKTEVQNCL